MVEKTELTLEDAKNSIREIIETDPEFTYPRQGEDERCGCVYLEDDDDWDSGCDESYDYSNCKWHIDDDNTCRYVHPDGSPSCVLGHYYKKGLGMPDEFIAKYETKSPLAILEGYGVTVSEDGLKFLNTIQSAQDQGLEWVNAYSRAVEEVAEPSNEGGSSGKPKDPRKGYDGQTEYLYKVDHRVDEDGRKVSIYAWGPDFEEARGRYENDDAVGKPYWERGVWDGPGTAVTWKLA